MAVKLRILCKKLNGLIDIKHGKIESKFPNGGFIDLVFYSCVRMGT
jgi:hypothetical protein